MCCFDCQERSAPCLKSGSGHWATGPGDGNMFLGDLVGQDTAADASYLENCLMATLEKKRLL